MSKPKLTEQDYIDAAAILDCEVAAIKAVAEVESLDSGFNADGSPKVLFEGHWFWKLTRGIFRNPENADVSYPRWVRTFYNMNQHARLQEAVALDRNAALKSASYGKFQIMGFNYKAAGFQTLQDFINAMYRSERDHLMAFVNFVISKGLKDELQRKDWAGFAYVYNGRGYKKNRYDEKMRAAYYKHSRRHAA